MIKSLPALLALALLASGAAGAPRRSMSAAPASPMPVPAIVPSAEALRVADWIAASGDNRTLPYAIVDKPNAAILLFDAQGNSLGQAPVLIGIAIGDDASPGVGSKKLGDLGPAEKTTPAGRFLARFGLAAGRQKVLWVDYADSVAIHPIPADAAKSERRSERMLSPESDDNRITFGCINVPAAFYGSLVRPLFRSKGGYVYVLPDTKPIETVFPRLRVHALARGDSSSGPPVSFK